MIKKEELEDKNKHKNNEKLLFHGTGPDKTDQINHHGFNRSFAGMNGISQIKYTLLQQMCLKGSSQLCHRTVFLNPGPGLPPTLHILCVSLIKHT